MNEQRIEELKNALREIVQMVTSSGKPLSDEMKLKLTQVMEHVANRIQQLRAEDQGNVEGLPPTPSAEPELQGAMPSSNIHSFGYDPENQRLLVKFNGENQRDSGPVYGYQGVPQNIFDIFRSGSVAARTNGQNKWGKWWKGKVPSIGAAMYTLIKQGNYPYQRLQ